MVVGARATAAPLAVKRAAAILGSITHRCLAAVAAAAVVVAAVETGPLLAVPWPVQLISSSGTYRYIVPLRYWWLH